LVFLKINGDILNKNKPIAVFLKEYLLAITKKRKLMVDAR
jgi:hypothetical protein